MQPPGQAGPQAHAAPGPAPRPSGRAIAAVSVGFAAPVLLVVPFLLGHDALDRIDPDVAAAQNAYFLTAVLGFGALAACLVLAFLLHWGGALGAAVGTLPLGLLFFSASEAYGPDGGTGPMVTMVLVVLLGVAGLLLGLLWRHGPDRAAAGVAGAGGALSGGFGLASVMLIADIEDQARMAEEANQPVPGLGLLLVVAALVLGALWWRRR